MHLYSYERICVSIPKEVTKKLRRYVPRGQRNKFIVEAIEAELLRDDKNIMLLENLQLEAKNSKD